MFITAFTRARHLSLPWVRLIQSIPSNPDPKVHCNSLLPTPRSSPSYSLALRSPHQIAVCTSPLLPPTDATCSPHPILLDVISLVRITIREAPRWASILSSSRSELALSVKILPPFKGRESAQPCSLTNPNVSQTNPVHTLSTCSLQILPHSTFHFITSVTK